MILPWCVAAMPLSCSLIFVQRVPKTWTCLKCEHTRTRVHSQIMGTSDTCFTEAWVSIGGSVWLCLGQHFAFSGREAHGILGSLAGYTGERILLFSTVTPRDRSVSFLHRSGQAANRGSLLSHKQKEGIPWFWGWKYQSAGQEALKLEGGGLGMCSQTHSSQ